MISHIGVTTEKGSRMCYIRVYVHCLCILEILEAIIYIPANERAKSMDKIWELGNPRRNIIHYKEKCFYGLNSGHLI